MTAELPTGRPADLAGLRVTVVGLGRFGGGLGVTRWLCNVGAKVTISDQADAAALAEAVSQLHGLDLTLHLGSHDPDDFLQADLLVVNPAVPTTMPLLAAAEAAGVRRTSEVNLFVERCCVPIVGITGTAGKSTTAAMTAAVLSRQRRTHLGGNIGGSLLESLGEISPGHAVVMELSSFQLDSLPLIGISPHVAVVTNLSANHLDRHGTMAAYAEAKTNIFRFQNDSDVLILNSACPATAAWADLAPGRVEWFDPAATAFQLAVPGEHNQANAQAAAAAGRCFGIDRPTIDDALGSFAGLPHRLSFVVERDGVRYFDDSKCTTPAGGIVALEAFEPRSVVVLVGGYDKGAAFDDLARAMAQRAKAVVAMGATKTKIAAALEANRLGRLPLLELADDLGGAVAAARRHAAPGDVVLLSPACASYDMFDNYQQRGQAFVELVTQ